jgi:hypothetical protein
VLTVRFLLLELLDKRLLSRLSLVDRVLVRVHNGSVLIAESRTSFCATGRLMLEFRAIPVCILVGVQ